MQSVVLQVALSLVLVVAASLFLRSLINLTKVDTGFNRENVLRLNIDPSSVGYKEDELRLIALYQQIEARISALPGVRKRPVFPTLLSPEGAGVARLQCRGMPLSYDVNVKRNIIGSGYFAAMQVPLIAGRVFGPEDTAEITASRGDQQAHNEDAVSRKAHPIGAGYYLGRRQQSKGSGHRHCEGCEVRYAG